MAKKRVAVLFGGVSSEYEVSCISAAAVVEHIPRDKYEVTTIGITKKGRWLLYPGGPERMRDGSWAEFSDNVPAYVSPDRTNRGIVANHGGSLDLLKLDVVWPVLHGRNGEDGTVQGLLEMAGLPYVGCGVLASAACMDKEFTNRLLEDAGLPHTPWLCAHRSELDDFEALVKRVRETLQYPIFVKPAVGGSSVGITKVADEAGLQEAMMTAGAHDGKILFEQGVQGIEVESAVLGNDGAFATLPGEIESCNEIYDYEAKYQSGDASRLYLPARLPEEKLAEVREMALRAYRALGCSGLARVDFFVERESGRVLVNEINTMPGFTSISMYPKLMEMSGLPFAELTDRLIGLAFERAEA